MKIAEEAAHLSYAEKLKVGSVAIRDTNILAYGYNGTLPGMDNTCEYVLEDGSLKTKDSVLHAEENLILKLAKSNTSSVGSTIYITVAPCIRCARMIAAAGISRVVYKNEYRSTDGIILLSEFGVKIDKLVA